MCQTFKFRLYPTKAQETLLHQVLATCCDVYNAFVNWRRHDYELYGTSPSYYDQKQALPLWKQQHPELSGVYSQVLQDVCKRVDLAYQAYFDRLQDFQERQASGRLRAGEATPGRPHMKGVGSYDSLTYPQSNGFKVGENSITFSKFGAIKAVIHRSLEGTPKTCILRRQSGKWFACICCEVRAQTLPPSDEVVGIDVGLIHFAVTSDEEFLDNPRFFRQEEKALKKAQRKASQLQHARNRAEKALRRKANQVVRRVHERIRNRRHDFVHQTARRLVDRYGLIAVEKLPIDNLLSRPAPQQEETTGQYLPSGASAKAGLNKSLADAAWSMFRMVLTYKAVSAGRQVVSVNPAYTSQDCSGCGVRVPKTLKERWHYCPNPECGLFLHRDVNAARNILRLALEMLQLSVGLHRGTAKTVEKPPA